MVAEIAGTQSAARPHGRRDRSNLPVPACTRRWIGHAGGSSRGRPMTEAQWLAATDPFELLVSVEADTTQRKTRLFADACCRRIARFLAAERSRNAIEVSDLYADGLASEAQLTASTAFSRLAPGGVRPVPVAVGRGADRRPRSAPPARPPGPARLGADGRIRAGWQETGHGVPGLQVIAAQVIAA